MKEQYPEGLYTNVNIELTLDKKTGIYGVYCPEWKYESYSKTPDKLINLLINEIINHNNQEVSNEE